LINLLQTNLLDTEKDPITFVTLLEVKLF